jgi:NAD+ kinase
MYFIFANPQKPDTIAVARHLAEWLIGQGERVMLDAWLHQLICIGQSGALSLLTHHTKAIISLGGDGTLLRVLSTAALHQIPVLGVNMGRVGFLLETDRTGIQSALERIQAHDYTLEERMMLRCQVNSGASQLFMNDVVLCRGASPSSIVVDAYADEELVYATHGDGMIVSTATGSTGYCLSAGGPILHPSLHCMVLLPICTHKAQQLPIVLQDDVRIRLKTDAVPGRTYQVVLDGQNTFDVQGAAEVIIEKATERAQFIRFDHQKFFTRLRQKQAEWSVI